MKRVWLITSGEPMPSNENRLHRTGMLSKLLAEKGYEVVWFTTTFDHQTKVYVENTNVKKNVSKNLSLFFLHSETPYYKNISLKRLNTSRDQTLPATALA